MRSYAKEIQSENGLTLIEVMATVFISSITLVVIYQVFFMGIRTYERVGIEMQLRDEADYIISTVLKELYENPADSVETSCEANTSGFPCLTVTRQSSIKVDQQYPGLVLEEGIGADSLRKTTFLFKNDQIVKLTKIGDEPAVETLLSTKDYSFEGSKIRITPCVNEQGTSQNSACKKGIIHISLRISSNEYSEGNRIAVNPLTLTSQIGF